MFEKEEFFFDENFDNIREKYLGKYVVISENEIIGAFDSDEQAFAGAIEAKCTIGEFMIKHITENKENQVQRFSNYVYV